MTTTTRNNSGFGGCPVCRGDDGYLNIGRDHWFHCREHRTAWRAGSNLFSGWRDETEADWDRNAATLAGFKTVKPYGENSLLRVVVVHHAATYLLDGIPFDYGTLEDQRHSFKTLPELIAGLHRRGLTADEVLTALANAVHVKGSDLGYEQEVPF